MKTSSSEAQAVRSSAAASRPERRAPHAFQSDAHATAFAQRGAATLLKQDATLAERLATTLSELAGDAAKRLAMAEAARSLAKPDAADRVADAVLQVGTQHSVKELEPHA